MAYGGGVKHFKQAMRKVSARPWTSIHYIESKKKLMAKAALMVHILSETMRDEYILTFANNGI